MYFYLPISYQISINVGRATCMIIHGGQAASSAWAGCGRHGQRNSQKPSIVAELAKLSKLLVLVSSNNRLDSALGSRRLFKQKGTKLRKAQSCEQAHAMPHASMLPVLLASKTAASIV
jgi:hypothetical protein